MGLPSVALVAAVNDEEILVKNLLSSPCVEGGEVVLRCYRGLESAGAAYNMGLDEADADLVAFAHQDVFLPESWLGNLTRAVAALARTDPTWAVLGAFGLDAGHAHAGHVWSTGLGRLLGGPFSEPVEASCLDELILVVRKASGVRFDAEMPGFHLYGTDVVLTADAMGLRSYVVDMPVVHNSRPVIRLRGDYLRARRHMIRKWRAKLPHPTLVLPLTRTDWPYVRHVAQRKLRSLTKPRHPRPNRVADPREISARLGI